MIQQHTLNQEEVEQCSKLASQWWDENGPFIALIPSGFNLLPKPSYKILVKKKVTI